MEKRQRPRNGIAGVSSKSRSLRAASQFCSFAASLKLLTRGGCYAGESPVLAVLAYADGNGGPTYPLPFPALKKRCGITVTDSRGFSPHSSNLERLTAFPRTQRRSSIFGCVLLVSPPSRGGSTPKHSPCAICVTIPCRASLSVDKLPHLLSTISSRTSQLLNDAHPHANRKDPQNYFK